MKLSDKNWKPFKISDLFYIVGGGDSKLSQIPSGFLPLISAKKINNGVRNYVDSTDVKKIFPGGKGLTINRNGDGGMGIAYYQPYNFALDTVDCSFLDPIKLMNENQLLFIKTVITNQRKHGAYSFAHKLSIKRLKVLQIMLPVDSLNKPDYDFMNDYIYNIIIHKKEWNNQFINLFLPEHKLCPIPKLEDKEWKDYSFNDLFDMQIGFYGKRPKEDKNGIIPLLGSTDSNNGVTEYLTKESIKDNAKTPSSVNLDLNNKIYKGPLIALNNSGSVGRAYYQSGIFTATSHITILRLKVHNLTENIALFIIPSIENQRQKFSFSRSWNITRMKRSRLLLPVDINHNIDWKYMEQYIENIKQEKRIKVI